MPRITRLKVCAEFGCPELTTQTRCPAHTRSFERDRESRVHRESQPWRRVYKDPRWAKLRAQVLREEPQCRTCGAPTTDVDHIVPTQDGGAPFDRANLQGLCHAHHSEKTAREVNERRGR